MNLRNANEKDNEQKKSSFLESKKQKCIGLIRHCLTAEKVDFTEIYAETGTVYFTAFDETWGRKVVIRLSDHHSKKIPREGTASVCTIRYDMLTLGKSDKENIKKCIENKIHKSPYCVREKAWNAVSNEIGVVSAKL